MVRAVSLKDLISHPHIQLGKRARFERPVIGTGFEHLDCFLPGGGWPNGAVTEVFAEHYGIGELTLLMPALARLSSGADAKWIIWIAPPFIPYAPALIRQGLNLDRVLMVHPSGERDGLWAVEQALRSGAGSAVLAWIRSAGDVVLRRLQLAAEERRCWAVFFRPVAALRQRSPAALRVKLSREGAQTRLEILKCRGGRPGIVNLDLSPTRWADEPGDVW